MSSSPLSRTVTVRNPEGLHLRPANMLVAIANQFQADLWLGNQADQVDCRSILSLVTLGAAEGTELTLRADGSDAKVALDVITHFFESGFAGDSDGFDGDESDGDGVTNAGLVTDVGSASDASSVADAREVADGS